MTRLGIHPIKTIKASFSHGIPMVFLCFPMVFLWFFYVSYGFPMVFLWFYPPDAFVRTPTRVPSAQRGLTLEKRGGGEALGERDMGFSHGKSVGNPWTCDFHQLIDLREILNRKP